MGIVDKIKEIEDEIKRTQKNKATEGHLGLLKAKLAKLRTQLLEPDSSGAKGEGFDVKKSGDARVVLIGFPSVGKSTLLSTITDTKSVAAGYEFTTLTCIPGVIHYNGTNIQLLDLPGIIEGAARGEGRGKQVIAVAKSADLVLMVLDALREREQHHREILERELRTVGLRLNQSPPNITFKKKATGGIVFTSTVTNTKLGADPRKTVERICKEYKFHNCEILMREDYGVDELIDVIEGNRHYVKCVYVYNKIDQVTIEHVDQLARQQHTVVMSCIPQLGIDGLLRAVWRYLGLVRIYTKRQGQPPDLSDPVVLTKGRGGLTVRAAVTQIHRSLLDTFKFAVVWGSSVKFSPQRVGLDHVLEDEDVMQIVKKTVLEERHSKNYSQKVQAFYDNYHEKKSGGKKKPLKS